MENEDVSYSDIKKKVMSHLKETFRPEFINRVDEIVVFHKLTKDQIYKIIDLMILRIETQLENQGVGIELAESAKEFLIGKGFDSVMGARPMRRSIQNYVEDPISEKIIGGEIKPGHKIKISAENGEMFFEIEDYYKAAVKV